MKKIWISRNVLAIISLILTNIIACVFLIRAITTKEGFEKFIYIILLISMLLGLGLIGFASITDNNESEM